VVGAVPGRSVGLFSASPGSVVVSVASLAPSVPCPAPRLWMQQSFRNHPPRPLRLARRWCRWPEAPRRVARPGRRGGSKSGASAFSRPRSVAAHAPRGQRNASHIRVAARGVELPIASARRLRIGEVDAPLRTGAAQTNLVTARRTRVIAEEAVATDPAAGPATGAALHRGGGCPGPGTSAPGCAPVPSLGSIRRCLALRPSAVVGLVVAASNGSREQEHGEGEGTNAGETPLGAVHGWSFLAGMVREGAVAGRVGVCRGKSAVATPCVGSCFARNNRRRPRGALHAVPGGVQRAAAAHHAMEERSLGRGDRREGGLPIHPVHRLAREPDRPPRLPLGGFGGREAGRVRRRHRSGLQRRRGRRHDGERRDLQRNPRRRARARRAGWGQPSNGRARGRRKDVGIVPNGEAKAEAPPLGRATSMPTRETSDQALAADCSGEAADLNMLP
jgi:hypothetical protein